MSSLSNGSTNANTVHQSKDLSRRFSLAEILSSTNNFDDTMVIGRGGFGNVYKGSIENNSTPVAIKRLNADSKQGASEFWTEIQTLSTLRHDHLVSLVGYCDEDEEKILIYEYVSNGTLADHIYKTRKRENKIVTNTLTWEKRLNICLGAARGLEYLHTGTEQSVIHRDVKTTNILLDSNWVPKISDFGLSKVGPASHVRSHVSTQVKGTFGYLDPTYFLTSKLTEKSDVYAFGVVLFEVLCGRPPLDLTLNEEDSSLVLWAQHWIKKGAVHRIIDPSLREQISTHSLVMYVEVAKKCLHSHPKGRPTMGEVAKSLELVLASLRTKPQRKWIITTLPLSIANLVSKGVEQGGRRLKGFDSKKRLSRQRDRDPFADESYKLCRRFSLAEIRAATDNFDDHLVIVENDHTKLYRGLFERGNLEVAIKRWKNGKSSESLKLFNTEVHVGSHLFHLHIVSILGYCIDRGELIIVYDYMEKGSIANQLYKSNDDPVPWEKRLEISISAAKGLQYLHSGAKQPIIHSNLKLSSLLLDKNWTAKIGGLNSPLVILDNSQNYFFNNIPESTLGYICPGYLENGLCSVKSDVYSFGVILLELVCCRKPMLINLRNADQVSLVRWFKTNKEMGTVDQIMDPHLSGKIAPECLKEYISIIENCVCDDGSKRPAMEDVLDCLRRAMRIQHQWQHINQEIVKGFLEEPCKEGTDMVSFKNLDDSDYLSVNLAR